MNAGKGRPQGAIPFKYGESSSEDGRPQEAIPFKYGESSSEDGRPQGAPPRVHTTPVPTILRCRLCSSCVYSRSSLLWASIVLWFFALFERYCDQSAPTSIRRILCVPTLGCRTRCCWHLDFIVSTELVAHSRHDFAGKISLTA